MSRAGAKKKFKGHVPGKLNVRRLDDDELAARQPHRVWLPDKYRLSEKAATPLGGLNLVGAITDSQYDAGSNYVVVVARYRATIGMPLAGFTGSARSIACKGHKGCDPCECRRRKERYDDAFAAVSEAGNRAARAVARVAVHGQACEAGEMDNLRRGLDALAKHFGT